MLARFMGSIAWWRTECITTGSFLTKVTGHFFVKRENRCTEGPYILVKNKAFSDPIISRNHILEGQCAKVGLFNAGIGS